jgi:hypothetical protein
LRRARSASVTLPTLQCTFSVIGSPLICRSWIAVPQLGDATSLDKVFFRPVSAGWRELGGACVPANRAPRAVPPLDCAGKVERRQRFGPWTKCPLISVYPRRSAVKNVPVQFAFLRAIRVNPPPLSAVALAKLDG